MSGFLSDQMRRPPLGDLLVSPVDVNHRDLSFPPWLDVLPTDPLHHQGYSFQGNPALNRIELAVSPLPQSSIGPGVHDDSRTQDFAPSQPSGTPSVVHQFNPDTPPKTPDNNSRRDTSKRKWEDPDDTLTLSTVSTFKKPKSLKTLQESNTDTLPLQLLSLSPLQLVTLVTGLVESNPGLRQELQSHLPEPDLSNQKQRLSQLMHNVYRALPRRRLSSTRGAFCYRWVRVHLSVFKKFCIQQGRHFVKCQSWKAAVEYSLMAWQYTTNLPVWDNPAHNKFRESCFQSLAAICMRALKQGQLDKHTLNTFRSRMQSASAADSVMGLCIKRLDLRLNYLSSM